MEGRILFPGMSGRDVCVVVWRPCRLREWVPLVDRLLGPLDRVIAGGVGGWLGGSEEL